MNTENALAGGDATPAQVNESESTSSPAAEQAQTSSASDAQTQEGSQTDAHGEGKSSEGENSGKSDAAKNTDKGKADEPKRNRAQERISELTRQKHDAERRAEALAKEVERLRKPLPAKADMSDDERAALSNRQAVRDEMRDQAEERAKVAAEAAHNSRRQIFEAKVAAIQDRSPDALAKFYSVPCTPMMADYLAEADKAGEMAAFLGSNPHEARRIAELPSARQAIELAKLEGRLQAAPEVRRVSQAPVPSETRLKGGASPSGFEPKRASVEDFQKALKSGGVIR